MLRCTRTCRTCPSRWVDPRRHAFSFLTPPQIFDRISRYLPIEQLFRLRRLNKATHNFYSTLIDDQFRRNMTVGSFWYMLVGIPIDVADRFLVTSHTGATSFTATKEMVRAYVYSTKGSPAAAFRRIICDNAATLERIDIQGLRWTVDDIESFDAQVADVVFPSLSTLVIGDIGFGGQNVSNMQYIDKVGLWDNIRITMASTVTRLLANAPRLKHLQLLRDQMSNLECHFQDNSSIPPLILHGRHPSLETFASTLPAYFNTLSELPGKY